MADADASDAGIQAPAENGVVPAPIEMAEVRIGQDAAGLTALLEKPDLRIGAVVGVKRSDGRITVGRVDSEDAETKMLRVVVNEEGDYKDVGDYELFWLYARLVSGQSTSEQAAPEQAAPEQAAPEQASNVITC